jgi:uncharacterized protein (DUF2236 family)
MQLAHPGVAAGVAEHSDFRRRPLDRLVRTLELTLALTFGTRTQMLGAARQINQVHQRVRGTGYQATDPRLLLWVHATLIDSALETYSLFVRPLPAADREAYYQEAKLLGGLLGLANSRYPTTLVEFRGYVDEMLGSTELHVDGRARELARAVLRPDVRGVPPPAFRVLEAVTAGLLPPSLRRDYDLRWGRIERMGFATVRTTLPRILHVLPGRFRQVPQARRAVRASSSLGDLTGRSS